mmetsp:Transcript_89809/g.257321  ORF Transcript_89809/g.257321 Transcript_89809/m.257321 type:complete len:315 (+) Transcript_89809:62-1006(+)
MPYQASVGIAFALASAGCSAFGQTLQRRSLLDAQKSGEEVPSPWRRKTWLLGSVLYSVAGIFDVLSYLFAPMAVIVVVYALRLPLVALLASQMLGVGLTKLGMIGILFCAAGAGLSLLFAPGVSGYVFSHPSDFFSPAIVAYVFASFIACCLLGGLVVCETKATANGGASFTRGLALPLCVAWTMNVEKLFNSAMGRLPPGDNCFSIEWLWLPSIVGLLMLVGGIMSLFAVEHQSTHTFVPVVFGFMATIMSIQSLIFGEFQNMDPVGATSWAVGVLAALFGTALISKAEGVEIGERCSVKLPAEPDPSERLQA